MTEKSDSAV